MAHCDSDPDFEPIIGTAEWCEAASSRDRIRRQSAAIEAMAEGRQVDLHSPCWICVFGRTDKTGDYRECAASTADEIFLVHVNGKSFHWACVNGNLPVARAIRAYIGDQSAKEYAYESICGALERGYVEMVEWAVNKLNLPRAKMAGYVKDKWDIRALPAESRAWIEGATTQQARVPEEPEGE